MDSPANALAPSSSSIVGPKAATTKDAEAQWISATQAVIQCASAYVLGELL